MVKNLLGVCEEKDRMEYLPYIHCYIISSAKSLLANAPAGLRVFKKNIGAHKRIKESDGLNLTPQMIGTCFFFTLLCLT